MPVSGVRDVLDRHADRWTAATQHPFLEGIREGTLTRDRFTRWLVQDRHFVAGLYPAQARIAALASERDWRVLDGGLTALLDELDWFDRHQRRLGACADQPPAPICRAFLDFLAALAFTPYPVAVSGLWAVEQAYFDGWTYARPGAADYREFVAHWTAPAFGTYVAALGRAADQAFETASVGDRRAAEAAVLQVAAYEHAFWDMSMAIER